MGEAKPHDELSRIGNRSVYVTARKNRNDVGVDGSKYDTIALNWQ